MSKYILRLKARRLRSKGKSVGEIAKQFGVAKSTASLWVRDIVLSVDQLETIRKKAIKGSERGRLKGSLTQKNKRLELIAKFNHDGFIEVGSLSDRELLLAGLSLYWAEGSKKVRKVQFCNSDPRLINFMILWLKKCFGVPLNRLHARVGINEFYKSKENEAIKFWSKSTRIPVAQFKKTSFKKVKLLKIFENDKNYFGTLEVYVLKPSQLYYKILGLIEGLANVAQW